MKLDRKHIMADLATQQLDFVIDLEQYLSPKITFDHLVTDEFVICSQLKEVDLASYISGRHIGVSSRRTGALLEDIYLNQHQKFQEMYLCAVKTTQRRYKFWEPKPTQYLPCPV